MSLDAGARLSLLFRMLVSLGFISVVTATIVVVAVGVTGSLVFLGITAAFFLVRTYILLFADVAPIAFVWNLWISNSVPIVLVIGAALLPTLYIQPVRDEIRAFRSEIGTTGELATDRHPKISTMVRRLSQQANISEPTVRIVNRRRPESYALGGTSSGTIVITRGVVRTLSDDELEAVLAHEVSHLRNGDGRIVNYLLVPMLVAERVGSADRPTFQFHYGLSVFSYGIRLVVWAVLTIVTTVQLALCRLGITHLSREREFAADRGTAELTGAPSSLASALERLHGVRSRPAEDMRDFKRSAGVLDILPPEGHRQRSGLFDTHPETETRVRRLESMVLEQAT
ncbi:M48 family metalloprotease [Halobacteria archaeon AArc-m2/3/4]|uniref:M48 family metalloprotease n=1 Tax=Natronoglomus mannanivorans TaxID=2979990 RepID=A0ABT2QJH0_9EURY|nr:M48 family metalloprotease [Halobacteria archaeon AArc-m2/3/4]